MVSNVEYLRSSLDALRHVIRQTNERARVAGKSKGYEEDDATMYEGMKPNGGYNMGEVKKRRGVSARRRIVTMTVQELTADSEPHHLDDATAATGSIPPNGEEARTAPEHYAMPVVCTMPSWNGSGSSRLDLSDKKARIDQHG